MNSKIFNQRIAFLFARWFGFTLFISLLVFIYFTLNSFHKRKQLLEKTVHENQQSQILELEGFFLNDYLPQWQFLSKKILVF